MFSCRELKENREIGSEKNDQFLVGASPGVQQLSHSIIKPLVG